MGRSRRCSGLTRRQQGQAIVLVLLLAVAGALVALSLVNTGILVSEKMQLQNAADATAFSISTLEARDLNFAAYTNRAMIANEVAVGQLVGLMSWSVMLDSVPGFVTSLPVVGQFLSPINAAKPATLWIRNAIRTFATTKVNPFSIPSLHKLNKFYSDMQRLMHLATLSMSAGTLFDMIAANADGARLTTFGYLALARHFTTHYGELSNGHPTYVVKYSQNETSLAQKEGMQRLASLINASRDPFTRDRKGGWSLPLIPSFRIHPPEIKIPIPFTKKKICLFCVDITFGVTVDRKGGSDLRYVERKGQQGYNWSAVDTLGGNVHLKWKVIIAGVSVPKPPIPLGAPFGIGAAKVGSHRFKPKEMWPDSIGGQVPEAAYGESPKYNGLAWLWFSPWPGDGGPYFAVNRKSNNGDEDYSGLPDYHDTLDGPWPIAFDKKDKLNSKTGWESPYLLISLYKPAEAIAQSEAKGRFELKHGTAHDELDVLGKSEVYFSRPNDLDYFARADGKTELGNAFNPYWDARLVDTSYLDRTAAMAMSQRQPWALANLAEPLDKLRQLLTFVPGLPR